MKIENCINMSPADLDKEILKERAKIKRAKSTIALLEKLKIANAKTENPSQQNATHDTQRKSEHKDFQNR